MNFLFKLFVFIIFFSFPNTLFAGSGDDSEYLRSNIQKLDEEKSSINLDKSVFHQSLQEAYVDNPTVRAARAELESVFERFPQAAAGWRPDIQAQSSVTYLKTDSGDGGFDGFDGAADNGNVSKEVTVSADQPLFRGFRTAAAMDAARAFIQAQLARIHAIEQDVLLQAATAYMDVYRDAALLRLSENNKKVLARQVEATQDRFLVGELTRTDVSQADARLARAEADVITARGTLRSSRAVYAQLIGREPVDQLNYPDVRLAVPADLDAIAKLAEEANYSVLEARFLNEAAEHDVDEVFGELLPELKLSGSWSASYDPQPGQLKDEKLGSVALVASMPLYESGATRSRIRQAKHTANQRYLEILEARRAARQEAISNWEALQAAKAEIRSRQAQVDATAIAQEGVREEAEFGTRTVLDSLDADQEHLDAQVAFVTAQRNEIVAQFALAATLGLLTPENLGFFEEEKNYDDTLKDVENDFLSLGTGINAEY